MNILEQKLIQLAESLAEQLITHLMIKLESKLGVQLPVPPQAVSTFEKEV
jgi:hypothetical protein